jgi:hypothetical protein
MSAMQESIRRLYRDNKGYIWSAFALTIVSLTGFKLIYPYPNMVLDSYYYVLAAISKADVNAWAIGYSWFIRFVGMFSHSPLLFVIVQYGLLQTALLVFWLTFTRCITLSKPAKRILFILLLANPIFLYTANFVMADSLFISLSLLWISLLISMVFRPKVYLLWVHAFLILLVFSVRYNALYYPFVAAVVFFLSGYSLRQKIFGIVLQLVVLGAFIGYTSFRVGQLSGQAQFSPFGNWKTANDALYMYGHVYENSRDTVPAKFAQLDRSVRQGFQLDKKIDDLLDYTSPFYGSIYMFYYSSGLVRYKNLLYGEDTEFVNFRKMAQVGPLYGQYGAYLIRKYPVAFLHYFVAPNACRYVLPPLEAYGSFPPFFLRPDYLGQAAVSWFGVKTITPSASAIRLRGYLLAPYQTLAAFVHLLFLVNLIGFGVMKGFRSLPRAEWLALLVLGAFWIFDLGFSLTAAATVMRYELLPLIIECSIVIWLTERIYFNSNSSSHL